ncbi:MAG TPA: lysophospholipid acyltransferase family protein [Myxococcota bacterium]|nr:lysophospholipid acyltransferase family protein [Myxococcota bacterium]
MNLLRACLSVWIWIAVALVAILGSVFQACLLAVTYPFDETRRIAGRFFRLMAVTAVKLSPMWRFRALKPYPSELRNTVVVSNHMSQLDSFLISHLPWEMKWLAKASLFRIPFIGWSMRAAGDIPVHRGAGASVNLAMRRCAEYLEQGMPVCIFPEGTRSTSEALLPFKDGAFRLAIETGSDVLPIAVAGTHKALPKHSWKFNFSRGLVKVGTPISTRGLSVDDITAVKAQARAQIEAMLEELRPLATPD